MGSDARMRPSSVIVAVFKRNVEVAPDDDRLALQLTQTTSMVFIPGPEANRGTSGAMGGYRAHPARAATTTR